MKITYFVHSITLDNERGLATGWQQGALSEEGELRARKLGEDMRSQVYDAVFCSDLHRAIQSTNLFFNDRHPIFIDWRLRECNYGDLDGTPASEFKKNREQEYINTPYKNGESYRDVQHRISRFLEDARLLYPDGHIAIVAHQAPQLALDVLIKNISWEEAIENDWRKTGSWQPGWNYDY